MLFLLRLLVLLMSLIAFCPVANAIQWQVVLSAGNPALSQSPLPATRAYIRAGLGNAAGALLGFQLAPSAGDLATGNWFEHDSIFTEYAASNTGGSLGPGRGGAQSADVFRQLFYGDSAGSSTRAFGAKAGDPGTSISNATTGIWLWNGTGNVEIARIGVDDILGPGLGSGIVYKSLHNTDSQDDVDVRMLPQGRVLFAGNIGSTNGNGQNSLSVYAPGQGNRPCMLQASTDANYGPGIMAKFSGLGANVTVSPQGDVYDLANVSATDQSPPGFHGAVGIWQFCDGAPRVAVLTGTTTEYGPDLADAGATFGGELTGLQAQIAPGQSGSFYFTSGGRYSDSTTFLGLFQHDEVSGHNLPILLEGEQGTLGPHIEGFVFHANTVPYHVLAAGRYAVLETTIVPAGASSPLTRGLWRISADDSALPVAIAGNTGVYAPASGRTWTGNFYKSAVFDNGDIVTLAETQNSANAGKTISWWRLGIAAAPVEILKVGDLVQVPSAGGMVDEPVTAIHASVSLSPPTSAGRDTWYSANGTILVDGATVQGHENQTLLIRGVAARTDEIFEDGFE